MSTALAHEILRDEPGFKSCMLGNLAIARGALEAGVGLATCYPGTPASEVGDTIAHIANDAGIKFEYSVNEKVAVEIAFAASLAGTRCLCSMKHLGLGYAGDPISTMPYVGVEGGLVIVSAGDPGCITSPNEQDQRHLSRFLYYPILDPATPHDALAMTRFGFALSEETKLPVVLRPTTRVCHTSGMVECGPLPAEKRPISFTKDPARHVPIPINARRMRQELMQRYARAEELLSRSEFFPRTGTGRHGVIASGVGYAYASQAIDDLGIADRVSLLQIGAYPIPVAILEGFLESVESILVVEELTPFVEECVTLAAFRSERRIPIYGKTSRHFPLAGEYDPDIVEDALREYVDLPKQKRKPAALPDLPPRPPVLCPGCPHRASFSHIRTVFGKKTVYCNDIGCYTLGYGEPLHSCDTLLCMGSSISQASALARVTGERTVAYLGDSTFFHSGLPPLANAVQAADKITVVILNNFVTAMTGFQPSIAGRADAPHMAAGEGSRPEKPTATKNLSLEQAVRGLGVTEIYSINQFDERSTLEALRLAGNGDGVNVIICNSPCVVHEKRLGIYEPRSPFHIDPEICVQCSACVRFVGCPSIYVSEGEFFIDQDLCEGCGLCAHVCTHGAIRR
ncbi:thiamine pyrophosphate-dependent enzyme [Candidatus Eisenbacteria bacterium]|uniref:Indolepyruvate oxidoreductase subunit IorA n=1 Tax=Eiseniibacteriota bacterium TaxID=2212470 RepID=A0ABV6YIC8_UNCEI